MGTDFILDSLSKTSLGCFNLGNSVVHPSQMSFDSSPDCCERKIKWKSSVDKRSVDYVVISVPVACTGRNIINRGVDASTPQRRCQILRKRFDATFNNAVTVYHNLNVTVFFRYVHIPCGPKNRKKYTNKNKNVDRIEIRPYST